MKIPQRIISVVPSQSELLWDLGLHQQLVGITKFCIHPNEMFKSVPHVGGTKTLNLDKINQLQPDLILANKEENQKEQIEALQKKHHVVVTDINTYDEALNTIKEIGKLTGTIEKALSLVQSIQTEFSALRKPTQRKRIVYLIWQNPYMVAGKNTFIDSLIEKAGFENCCTTSRYPVITTEEIKALNPDYLFLSSEPYPFKVSHFKQFDFMQSDRIKLVDGEMFSWYGSRLKKAPAYFNQLLSAIH